MNFSDIEEGRQKQSFAKEAAQLRAEADAKEKAAAKAEALQNFRQNFFGTPRREADAKRQADWAQHCARIDADPKNLNFYRVSFPTSIWAKDPVTGQAREPGVIDLGELHLEDISIEAYQKIHGPVVPSGFYAGTDVSGIMDKEKAEAIIKQYGLEWDIQGARVSSMKAKMFEEIKQALNPWQFSGGQQRMDITERIEAALTMKTPRSAGVQALFGKEAKPSDDSSFVTEGVDDLVSMAIRYDTGQDRALAYALAIRLADNPSFKPRLFMLQRELRDENLANLYRFNVLYGAWATDRRSFSKLAPRACPDFLRYGVQEQMERDLQAQMERNAQASGLSK